MKQNRVFTIVFFSVLGVVLLAFFYLTAPDNKRYNWRETYDAESNQPYGTKFIREMLKSYASDGFVYNTKKPVHELLDSAGVKGKSAYVILGNSVFVDSVGIEAMKKYIDAGNDVFLITPYLPDIVAEAFYQPECSEFFFSQTLDTATVRTNFYHPSFAAKRPYIFTYRVNDDDVRYYWGHLSADILCDSLKSIVPLGYFQPDYINFLKIPYGQGSLFIHTNPLLFTNYFMVNERHTDYASSVFSHSSSKSFIWDEHSKEPSYQRNTNPYYNPLYFIMEQRSLRYAWWVMLATTLLYVFFAAKRIQRFIPVLEQKANTSLAFLKMVSSLHYHNQNHGNMARKKMRHFLHFIRTKYSIPTHKVDEDFIKKLSIKSLVSESEIESIFNQYQVVDKFQTIDASRLAELYNAIQNFYQKAK